MQYYFSGVANWAKVKTPVDNYDTTKPQEYKIDVVLDNKSWKLFEESGCQLRPKQTPDGERYVTFKCPVEATIKSKVVTFKPTVLNSDNQPFDGLIGNGSGVTCKVDVYPTRMGMGHRLDTVRVDSLIEFAGGGTPQGDVDNPF